MYAPLTTSHPLPVNFDCGTARLVATETNIARDMSGREMPSKAVAGPQVKSLSTGAT